jgi:hypothetical protein
MPAESHPLSGLEERDVSTGGIDDTGDLVTGNARILKAGPLALPGERIAVTDAASMDANPYLARARGCKSFLDELKWTAGGGDLHGSASD